MEKGKALELMAACMTRNMKGLTPWLTGAGARSAEGTDIGHENAEGMAYVGVRVEPPVSPCSKMLQYEIALNV